MTGASLTNQDLSVNRYLEHKIKGLQCRCENKGCEVMCSVRNLEEHGRECAFRLVDCEKCCKRVRLNILSSHANMVECKICFESDPACLFDSLHNLACPNGCAVKICNSMRVGHSSFCTNALVNCMFSEIGCDYSCSRGAMSTHELDAQLHLNLALNEITFLKSQLTDVRGNLESKNRELSVEKNTSALLRARLDPSNTVSLMLYSMNWAGGHVPVKHAFNEAVVLKEKLFFVPWESNKILLTLNAKGGVVSFFPLQNFPRMAYSGAVVAQNRVYFLPFRTFDQAFYHFFDTSTSQLFAYKSPNTDVQKWSYSGGCYVESVHRIYLAPNYQDTKKVCWHYIDCLTNRIQEYRSPDISKTEVAMYRGAVFSPKQNRVFFLPGGQANECQWHCCDVKQNLVCSYSVYSKSVKIVENGFRGGAYSPLQDRIYLAPFNQGPSDKWHYIDCASCKVVPFSSECGFNAVKEAYVGAAYSPNTNRIYFAPFNQATEARWHFIDCNTSTVVAYPSGVKVSESAAYAGVVYYPAEKRVYFIPHGQSNHEKWHYIQE